MIGDSSSLVAQRLPITVDNPSNKEPVGAMGISGQLSRGWHGNASTSAVWASFRVLRYPPAIGQEAINLPDQDLGQFVSDSQDANAPSIAARLLGMDELTRRLLKLFIEMGSESLDLHTLFEAGGNDPESRKRVLDVVTGLVDTGLLESRGSDFYLLTDKGRKAVR